MDLLRIGLTSALVAAWYAAVLTFVAYTANPERGGKAAAQRMDVTAVALGPSVQSGFPLEEFRTGGDSTTTPGLRRCGSEEAGPGTATVEFVAEPLT